MRQNGLEEAGRAERLQRDSGSLLPLQFHPHSGPLRGSTKLTLCGSNFYLHPAGLVPKGTHQITVGQSPCRLLPKDSSNHRYNWSLLPFLSLMGATQQSLPCETLPSAYWGPGGMKQAGMALAAFVSRETTLSLLEPVCALPIS